MIFPVILFVITVAYTSVAAYADEAEPHIPEWISDLTQYYTDGLLTADEYTTAISYLLDEDIIYLGEPPQTIPNLYMVLSQETWTETPYTLMM